MTLDTLLLLPLVVVIGGDELLPLVNDLSLVMEVPFVKEGP